jgi:RNA polymerase sigma-70 factor (ECF subfamily)
MIEPAMPENRENSTIQCLSSQSLVDEHLGAVYRYAYRLTGTVQDAEDLTQQVFLLAQQRLEQLREADRARGWLFAILRNQFLKTVERTVPVAAASVGLNLDTVVAASDDDGAAIDSQALQAAINQLPAEYRLALVMFYFEEYSYRQIAEKLELPIGTVMSRLARAKRQLRASLWEADEKPARPKPVSAH